MADGSINLPIIINQGGLVPQTIDSLQTQLLNNATALSPGLTANLPGILIEDISSTEVAGISLCDQAKVETVDSLTPFGCNAYLLNELGQMLGVPLGQSTNTSVQEVFNGPPGFVIPPGFLVGDGTYTYITYSGGVVGNNSQSAPITFVATTAGSWAIPVGTVTQIETSVPSQYNLTCSNPYSGVPAVEAQDETSYRAQVLQANLASAIGMPRFIKTALLNVPGVQARLISFQQQTGGGWKALVGGAYDPYQVAWALFNGGGDVSTLVGSTLSILNITTSVNAVVTTALTHNYSNGQIVYAYGVSGMSLINGVPLTVTVIDQWNFSTGVSSTTLGAYTSGGYLLPNFRNNIITLTNFPDVYDISFVSPPLQTVTATVLWSTTQTGYINQSAITQLAGPALAAYINSIVVGQPINILQLNDAFVNSIASILATSQISDLQFEVAINGVGTLPTANTNMIYGDPESYFYSDPLGSGFSIAQV